MRRAWICSVLLCLAFAGFDATAQELGVQGETYRIAEPDMQTLLEAKAKEFVDSGRYEQWKNESIDRARETMFRPPSAALARAEQRREWLHDPSAALKEPVTSPTGQVLAPAGTRINPLDYVSLPEPLAFFDGDDAGQVEWAQKVMKQFGAKPILTAGAWVELTKKWHRQVYYDINGWMTAKLGIERVPALVTQDGRNLRIAEIPPPKTKEGD